jgi:hypothetical protein
VTKRFDGLTKAHEELFERIAIGDDRFVNERTVASLIAKGLVEKYEQQDGPFIWFRYRTPIAVHIRWCEWCATQEEHTDEPHS